MAHCWVLRGRLVFSGMHRPCSRCGVGVVVCGWVVKCRVDASIFFLDRPCTVSLVWCVVVVCLMTV